MLHVLFLDFKGKGPFDGSTLRPNHAFGRKQYLFFDSAVPVRIPSVQLWGRVFWQEGFGDQIRQGGRSVEPQGYYRSHEVLWPWSIEVHA